MGILFSEFLYTAACALIKSQLLYIKSLSHTFFPCIFAVKFDDNLILFLSQVLFFSLDIQKIFFFLFQVQ